MRLCSLLRFAVLICLVGFAAQAAAHADEPAGVPLLRPDSLLGWDYSPVAPHGWSVENGTLRAGDGANELLSGFSWGPGKLSGSWQATDAAPLTLLLPTVPTGTVWQIHLAEGDRAGEIRAGDAVKVVGVKLAPRTSGLHTFQLTRKGAELQLQVDDLPVVAVEVGADARFGIGLKAAGPGATVSDLRLAEPAGEALFNGKDLTGWWTPGKLESWPVQEGDLVCINKNGNYLRTDKEYGNFTLSLDYKITKGGNSGVGIRTPRNGWPSGDGMEIQIMDEKATAKRTRQSSLAIYGNLEPAARADLPETWNHMVIKADGYVISAWMNGVLCQQANTRWLPELQHRNLQGWIGFQDHGAVIHFRNINLLEAPAGTGLQAWYERATETPSQQILSRLMNPERLTRPGNTFQEQQQFFSVPAGAAEQVVAELTGPAVLVGWHASTINGKVTLAFDGETKPRIDLKLQDLRGKLTPIVEEKQPSLTYVPFAKKLKISVRELKEPLALRLDTIALPNDPELTSFAGSEESVSRGLLPALSYRRQQHGWGKVREYDPLPRLTGSVAKLAPGESAPVLTHTGQGLVQWLQFKVDPAVVKNTDLWVEITVAGQKQPQVAAPLRFLVPGIHVGNRHENFVNIVTGGGFTTRLPIPFHDGLQISLTNKGEKPLPKIEVIAALQPDPTAAGDAVPRRAELHGVFLPAGSVKEDELAQISGRGLWVGLVAETPDGALPEITGLAVDGNTLPNWKAVTASTFFGLPSNSTDATTATSGIRGGLAWRYLLLAPIRFERGLQIQTTAGSSAGNRLVLFYLQP